MRRALLLCLVASVRAQEADGAGADERAKAVRALGRAGEVEAVRAALLDEDGGVRAAAAVALVRLGASDPRVVPTLTAALSDPDWYTRWDACVALGSLGKAAAVAAPALLAAAGDRDRDLARDAAIALSRVMPKDPQVAAALVRVVESDRDVDRRTLLLVLERTGHAGLANGLARAGAGLGPARTPP